MALPGVKYAELATHGSIESKPTSHREHLVKVPSKINLEFNPDLVVPRHPKVSPSHKAPIDVAIINMSPVPLEPKDVLTVTHSQFNPRVTQKKPFIPSPP